MTSTPTRAEKIAALRLCVDHYRKQRWPGGDATIALAEQGIADLEAGEQGWRPIADDPPNDIPVLVHDGHGIEIAWRKGNHWRSHLDVLRPTHWRPIPQPPAESREEDLCNRPGCGPEFCRNDTDCPRITGTPDAPSPVGGADPDGEVVEIEQPTYSNVPHRALRYERPISASEVSKKVFRSWLENRSRILAEAAPAPTAGDAVERGRDGHGEHCWYCGDRCNGFAGNPGLWPLLLPLDDARPGHCVAVHTRCVLDRLKRAGEVARAERAALLEKIRESSVIEDACRRAADKQTGFVCWAGITVHRAADVVDAVLGEIAVHLSGDQP